jgi:hypothetical protein
MGIIEYACAIWKQRSKDSILVACPIVELIFGQVFGELIAKPAPVVGFYFLILYRTNVIARRSLPKQSPVYGNFRSKEDCRAAKEQERRLAMT